MQRRSFLNMLSTAGGGLFLGIHSGGCVSLGNKKIREAYEKDKNFEPNAFLSILSDGRVRLALSKSEMGQGIMTAAATLVAEELEISPSMIDVVQMYKTEFGMQMTGGSNSTKTIFKPLRLAAASARDMLRQAAADTWNVSIETCVAQDGSIHHSSGKKQSYTELLPQASQQSLPKNPKLKSQSEFRYIGKDTPRVDAFDKSIGRAKFGTDVDVEGKVCAYVIRPPIMGGNVKSLDVQKAKSQIGVLDVFAFERGIAVIAQKYWQAKRAARFVDVEWEDGMLKGLHTQEMLVAAQKRSQQKGEFQRKNIGNVDNIESKNLQNIQLQYDFPYLSHATMEPQNCTTAVYDDRVEMWVPTQAPTQCARAAADLLNIPIENVKVNIMMLGGGFGRRASIDFVMESLYISQKYPNVPVQVMWTREDDMTMGYYRPTGTCHIKGSITEEGEIVSLHAHLVSQYHFADMTDFLVGIFPSVIPPKLRQKMATTSSDYISTTGFMGFFELGELMSLKYEIPNIRSEYTPINVPVPVAAWRSVSHSYSTFILETCIDQLSSLVGQDPIDIRKRMLSKHPRHVAVLESILKESKWGEPIEEGWGRGFAMSEFGGSVVAQVVEAGIIEDKIVVRHVTCATDCGLVVNPNIVRDQIESGIIFGLSMLEQKIDIVDGVVQQKNFDDFPVMRMYQVPIIHTILIPSESKPTGIGEISLPPIHAAVANAIYAATGVRLTHMPIQSAWQSHQNLKKSTGAP